MYVYTVRFFWRHLADRRGFWAGAVKRQILFPPVPLTKQIERNDAQTRRKIRSKTSLKKSHPKRRHDCYRSTNKISIGNSPGHEYG